jgi:hypothetical protein
MSDHTQYGSRITHQVLERVGMLIDVHVGDVVRLRKPHPCGSTDWQITRVGADIGLRCLGCGRRVMLPRDVFRRRAKRIVTPAGQPPEGGTGGGEGASL